MSKIDWSKARTILSRVLEAPEEDQARVLEEECAGDQDLLDGLRDLLAREQDETRFLEPPPILGALGGEVAAGERIGPWRLDRVIGTGGMGTVWLAHRADGAYEQRVALKVARLGYGTGDFMQRLERERALLARLEHSGIARLIDGGATSDGAPYFALEYVDGQRLDAYADEHRLDVPARIRLFLEILSAVDYAHRSGLVHRDIKPANVLVTEDGAPKLLDFGIAKLVEDEASAHTTEHLMTPRYASPEQVRGEPLTLAVDVYALGVLFYELLSGNWPYSASPTSLFDVQKAIRDEPPRPLWRSASSEETASARSTTVDGLQRALGEDLDWILAKALAKEPGERYPSVGDFAGDLENYLAGFPVEARPDTASYRASKFVRRNRTVVVSLVVVFVTLVVALAYSIRQNFIASEAARNSAREAARASAAEAESAREAERASAAEAAALERLEQIRGIGRDLVFELHGDIARLPGSARAQRATLERGLAFLESDDPAAPLDTELALQVAEGFLTLAGVMSSSDGLSLGQHREAEVDIARSLELYESVLAAEPELPAALAGRVYATLQLGDVLLAERRVGEARERADEAWRFFEESPDPEAPELRAAGDLVARMIALCEAMEGRPDDALRWLDEAARLGTGIEGGGDRSVGYFSVRGAALLGRGDVEGAIAAYRRGLELLERHSGLRGHEPQFAAEMSSLRLSLGRALIDAGRPHEALLPLEQSLAVLEQVFELDPSDRGKHMELIDLHRTLGRIALDDRRFADAKGHFDDALGCYDRALERWPEDSGFAVRQAVLLGFIAQAWLTAGVQRFEGVALTGPAVLDSYRRAMSRFPHLGALGSAVAFHMAAEVQGDVQAFDYDQAAKAARRAVDRAEDVLAAVPEEPTLTQNLGVYHGLLGQALLRQGKLEEAREAVERYYEFSLENLDRYPQQSWSRRNVLYAVDTAGGLYFHLGQEARFSPNERRTYVERALELYGESYARARELVDEGLMPASTEEAIAATARSMEDCEALLDGLRVE